MEHFVRLQPSKLGKSCSVNSLLTWLLQIAKINEIDYGGDLPPEAQTQLKLMCTKLQALQERTAGILQRVCSVLWNSIRIAERYNDLQPRGSWPFTPTALPRTSNPEINSRMMAF
jgi:hypothetical protein